MLNGNSGVGSFSGHLENSAGYAGDCGWSASPGIHAQRQSFKVNEAIRFDQCDKQPVIFIRNGAIGLQHILRDGRRTISTMFTTGELMDFRNMDFSSGSLTCLSPVEITVYDPEMFEQLQKDNPDMLAALAASFSRQHVLTASHCVDLARKTAIEKLASFIFECRSRQMVGRGMKICLTLKRIDIADYMGLRQETLSRAFARLKKLRLISIDADDRVKILNEPTLRQIANGACEDMRWAA